MRLLPMKRDDTIFQVIVLSLISSGLSKKNKGAEKKPVVPVNSLLKFLKVGPDTVAGSAGSSKGVDGSLGTGMNL